MAHVVRKTGRLTSGKDVVMFQLITYIFLKNIRLSNCEMECLVQLGMMGVQDLSSFCVNPVISDEKIKDSREYETEYSSKGMKSGLFKSAQAVRNVIKKCGNKGLILKEGKSRKRIQLHPDLGIFIPDDSTILDYKFAYVETQEP